MNNNALLKKISMQELYQGNKRSHEKELSINISKDGDN